MYYKITNKDSEVYKKLHEMRTNELRMDDDNLKAVQELTQFPWVHYLHNGRAQRNMIRTTYYLGFEFLELSKVNPNLWKSDQDYPEMYIPNHRTKVGKELFVKLNKINRNGNSFHVPLNILGIQETGRKFKLPYVEIYGDIIILSLDDNHEPTDTENVLEITRREFIAIENGLY